MNTHGLIVDFGKHKGLPYTRLPCNYLFWMVQSQHTKADIAAAELERRGTVKPELDISGHAIDSASLRLLNKWQGSKKADEGLHAWLCRMSVEALNSGFRDGDLVIYHGIKFVFQPGEWPVLKTVMKASDAKIRKLENLFAVDPESQAAAQMDDNP